MVSIIIPIYNTESYLDECLQSVINQTYQDWELILVDDGSTDRSKEICIKYQEKDKRISCIFQSNHGVSYARNQGLRKAKGKYVYFMDSDDIAEPNLLEKAVDNMADLDMVYFNIVTFSENSTGCQFSKVYQGLTIFYENRKRQEFILKQYLNFKLCYFSCNKLYSLNIIKNNHISFDEKVSIGEDLGFNLTFLLYAKKIKGLPDILYRYRKRNGSAMNTVGKLQLRLNDFSLMLERIQFHAKKYGMSQAEFSLIFMKTMDNQYKKCTNRKEFKPYVQLVQNRKFLAYQTVDALSHPLRFIQVFGNAEAKMKWIDYTYIIKYLLFAWRREKE